MIVRKRWEPPKATIDGIETKVDRDNWSAIQQEGNHKNRKAMITIVSSLSKEEGGKLLYCTSVKQMWQTLENHYEGNV